MQAASWVGVIRDVNLSKIQRESASPFSVLFVGESSLTQPLADVFGRTNRVGQRHPAVSQHEQPLPDGLELVLPALAVVVSPKPDLDIEMRDTLRRLKAAGVVTITLLVGDRSLWPEAAWALRANEDARVAIPPQPTDAAVQTGIGPTVAALDREGKLPMMAMARQLPVLRLPYAQALAEDVARTNAGFALSTGLVTLVPGLALPLTAADIVVLTKNQIVMAYRIALASNKPGDARTVVGEVVGVIGAGLLFRQIARELIGLVPGIGIVPKVAISYAGTHLVAKVVTAWAIEGRTVEIDELRYLYDSSLARGHAVAQELRARRQSGTTGGSRSLGRPRLPARLPARLPKALPARLSGRLRRGGQATTAEPTEAAGDLVRDGSPGPETSEVTNID